MIVIQEANSSILRLLGIPKTDQNIHYRLMKYVLRVEYANYVSLFNTLTNKHILLNNSEIKIVESDNMHSSAVTSKLIKDFFIVPQNYNEYEIVNGIRAIMRKLYHRKRKTITKFTILPTTACNARCYYCFEQGAPIKTMSEKTADCIVDFIAKHCNKSETAKIKWFGGEPTIAAGIIERICGSLKDRGINYESTMISNGYLFDNTMAENAKNIWNLKRIQISVDGVSDTYNNIKAYVNTKDDPYQRILQNIKLLTDRGINTVIRMNIDLENAEEFQILVDDIMKKYANNPFLQVYAYPIIGEYPNKNGEIIHADDTRMSEIIIQLNNYSRAKGLYKPVFDLPSFIFSGCSADDDSSIVINPDGNLCRCMEKFDGDEIVGNILTGITNNFHYLSWKEVASHEKCKDCVFYPACVKMSNCKSKSVCNYYDRNAQFIIAVQKKVEDYLQNIKKE